MKNNMKTIRFYGQFCIFPALVPPAGFDASQRSSGSRIWCVTSWNWLEVCRYGTVLENLWPVLENLSPVPGNLKPVLWDLDPVLEDLDTVLEDSGPVLKDLEPVLGDLHPVLENLGHVLEDKS